MNKNTYLGLVLAASLGIVSIPVLAEVAAADSTAPEIKITERLEPSELQRQTEEQNNSTITEPETSVKERLEPSELQRQQVEQNKATITEPEPSVKDRLVKWTPLSRQLNT